MKQHKDIKITGITSEAFDASALEKILQPLLARINAELGEIFRPPPAIDPAHASSPSAGGYFGGVGYASASKEVKIKKTGKETFDYSIQSVVERKTVASGFIGIGSYSKEIQNRLITVVPKGPFKSAYLLLPATASLEQLGIARADLEVALKRDDVEGGFQTVTWTPSTAWTSGGKMRNHLVFGLLDDGREDPTLGRTRFVTRLTLTTPLQTLATEQSIPAFDHPT
jgi:hypothetical protein